jgi:hypothetical protein
MPTMVLQYKGENVAQVELSKLFSLFPLFTPCYEKLPIGQTKFCVFCFPIDTDDSFNEKQATDAPDVHGGLGYDQSYAKYFNSGNSYKSILSKKTTSHLAAPSSLSQLITSPS